ncbi:MAG TPA: TM2 domain-containing protein [Phycisphaerae bacterium]|nr:TM2 domain-containing protein [Phycisphaerae bacterium]
MAYVTLTSNKSRLIALLLCVFGGLFGLHRFYVLRLATGILYVFTLGFFLIGWLVDLVKILTGSFTDNVGQPLRKW